MTLFTIGHGNDTINEFVGRLDKHDVETLVDVRSFPGSRRTPHFGKESMAGWLPAASTGYVHVPALGGRRKPPREPVPQDSWWRVEAFASYAAATRTPEYGAALFPLLLAATYSNVAVMCGEPCWWRCHRRMIADLAVLTGIETYHIMPTTGVLNEHEPSEWARELVKA